MSSSPALFHLLEQVAFKIKFVAKATERTVVQCRRFDFSFVETRSWREYQAPSLVLASKPTSKQLPHYIHSCPQECCRYIYLTPFAICYPGELRRPLPLALKDRRLAAERPTRQLPLLLHIKGLIPQNKSPPPQTPAPARHC